MRKIIIILLSNITLCFANSWQDFLNLDINYSNINNNNIFLIGYGFDSKLEKNYVKLDNHNYEFLKFKVGSKLANKENQFIYSFNFLSESLPIWFTRSWVGYREGNFNADGNIPGPEVLEFGIDLMKYDKTGFLILNR